MPELPEVETVRRGLMQHIEGKHIHTVLARRRDLRSPLPKNFEKAITGSVIKHITRRAKYLLFHLNNAQVLIVHLGMSGSLVLKEALPNQYRKHDHVILTFKEGGALLFHDPRRFGLMMLVTETALAKHKLLAGLGPEPLDEKIDGAYLYTLLQSTKAPVKSAVMDQRKLVGVGNIYACEALFRAKIHPSRPANKVTKKEADALMKAIKQVLEEAIVSGGSTLRDYVRSSGDAGYFQHHFSVYGRHKLPCVVCKNPVAVMRQSGRSTFFCAHCQK
jgi:formamidopyrimidine-DNA glycosylase